jgi:putative sterol carrier protein
VFAGLVSEATDDQLREGFATNRELILGEIFSRMPERLDPQRAAGVDEVVEWRIRDRPGGGHDTWHLIIKGGECRMVEGAAESPSVTYEVGPVDFIRLITGNASGPKLFLFGRLKIRGDLVLGARMQTLFSIPAARD